MLRPHLLNSLRRLNRPKSHRVPWRQLSSQPELNIVSSPFQEVDIPRLTIPEYIWQNFSKWEDKTAVVCGVTGRGYTYSQAHRMSTSLAASLRLKLGMVDGDTVSVMLPNMPEFPLVTLGALSAGCVVSTINPVYTAHEIQRQIVLSHSKAVFTTADKSNVVKEALRIAKLNIPIIVVKRPEESTPPGTILFEQFAEDFNIDKGCLKKVRRSTEDYGILPYSSGTTGLPKGVELEHRNIIANCQQISEEAVKCHEDTTKSHQDAVMAVLPFFHIYGLVVVMLHKLFHGLKVVTVPHFQPDTYLDSLLKHKITSIYAAPPLVLFMATHPMITPHHYQYLHALISGAAPLPPADIQRLFDKAQREFYFLEGYGLTECSPVVSMTKKQVKAYGTIGHPMPNTEIKIVDGEGKSLGPDEAGEMLVRGPQVMRGYHDNPEANEQVFAPGGWLRTGDMASYSREGVLTIRGRFKELIKVKGYQVPPAELESLLREHPDVADAAVVGTPHPVHGEVPRAFIVKKSSSDVQPQTLLDFVAERVAPYKKIAHLEFINAIPKNSSGKIMRKDLENMKLP